MSTSKTPYDLDALFEDARQEIPDPSDALMAAVLRDAQDVQAQIRVETTPKSGTARSAWTSFMDSFGGWPAMATYAACATFGLWVGYGTGIESIADLAGLLEAESLSDLPSLTDLSDLQLES